MRFVCKISLSFLETRENTFGFLFSSRTWRKYLKFLHFFAKVLVLFSNQETDLDISLFSSQNSRCEFHISLSLLELTFWHLVNACTTILFTIFDTNSTGFFEGLFQSIWLFQCLVIFFSRYNRKMGPKLRADKKLRIFVKIFVI